MAACTQGIKGSLKLLSVCLFDHAALASGGHISILLSLQRQEWLHERGRTFCDLKLENSRIQVGLQPGTFGQVTLVDLGSVHAVQCSVILLLAEL